MTALLLLREELCFGFSVFMGNGPSFADRVSCTSSGFILLSRVVVNFRELFGVQRLGSRMASLLAESFSLRKPFSSESSIVSPGIRFHVDFVDLGREMQGFLSTRKLFSDDVQCAIFSVALRSSQVRDSRGMSARQGKRFGAPSRS